MEGYKLQLLYFILFFVTAIFYQRIAKYFKIYAVPNHRSTHNNTTITGGGIIIPIACLLYFITSKFNYPYLLSGLLILALVSFIDDIKDASITLRLVAQLLAIALAIIQFNAYASGLLLLLPLVVVMFISINAYNFVDGINGVTACYSLAQMAVFYYINSYIVQFIDGELLIMVGLAIIVFMYFNLRVKAKYFAGDVGSIPMGFLVFSCLLKLIVQTHNFIYLTFLLVYYLDTVTTFAFRWIQGDNVLEGHKKHFYQYLVRNAKLPHVVVGIMYAILQAGLNFIIIYSFGVKGSSAGYYNLTYTALIFICTFAGFIALRTKLEGNPFVLKKGFNTVMRRNQINQFSKKT